MACKFLVRILLDKVSEKLLPHQSHDQSGFTSRKSSVEGSLTFRVLTEHPDDFHTGLLEAYVNLGKEFDSVNGDVLWRILTFRGIPFRSHDGNYHPYVFSGK